MKASSQQSGPTGQDLTGASDPEAFERIKAAWDDAAKGLKKADKFSDPDFRIREPKPPPAFGSG